MTRPKKSLTEKDGNWEEASNMTTHPKKLLAEDGNWKEALIR